jgi:hypothetical protein
LIELLESKMKAGVHLYFHLEKAIPYYFTPGK